MILYLKYKYKDYKIWVKHLSIVSKAICHFNKLHMYSAYN